MMKTERWRQIDKLLDAALELPPDERESFLLEACGNDEDLHREVESLLKANENAGGFMESPAIEIAAKVVAQEKTLADTSSFIGREIGQYKIERLLGSGGMGEVFLAHDAKLNRKVALKILPAQFVTDVERVRRFEREAHAVSALNHPNLITIYDIEQANGLHFIATEYVEGKTVRELIGNIKMKDALSIATQTAEALNAAHNTGIIHRDIKPENIMLRPDGYVKVLDFGLAKLIEPTSQELNNSLSQTQKGVVMGTLSYMSPEQASGENVDNRSDIWSLGAVLYEMATGLSPFKRATRQETFNAILSEDPLSVTDSNPTLHTQLDHIINKALEKDRELRYQTALDFRADLKRLKREIDSSPSLSGGRAGSKKQSRFKSFDSHRNYRLIALTAFITIILLVGLWFFISRFLLKANIAEGPDWSKATNKQLTDFPGPETHPSLSPDGKSFIYIKRDGEKNDYDIFLQRVGGKNVRNLTPDSPANETTPTYSFDGKMIAFHSTREPEGIYIMEETGENPRRISNFGFYPSWSPDGKEVVVCEQPSNKSRTSALWAIDIATTNKRMVTKGDAVQPSWSPNGHRVAYWFIAKGRLGDIATVPANGGEPVLITNHEATDINPVWSPDGKYIYFSSDRSGNMNLWRIAVDEKTGEPLGEAEPVVTPSKYSVNVTFSRDGKLLAYTRNEGYSNIHAISFNPLTGKATDEPVQITQGNKEINAPDMSPNGEQYVVTQSGLTQLDLVIFNKDGSNWRMLTNDKFRERTPRWSPDGKQIAFQSSRGGNLQIWVINTDGTGLKQVTFADENGTHAPVWSPDGTRLLVNKINEHGIQPLILDMSKSWHEQTPQPLPPVNDFDGTFTALDWSFDGDKIIGVLLDRGERGSGIAVYSFSNNRYERITTYGDFTYWLKDGRRFMFKSGTKICLGDAQTKKTTEIFSNVLYPAAEAGISADNKNIYFRVAKSEGDIWLLSLEQTGQ